MPELDGIELTKELRLYYQNDLGIDNMHQPTIVGVSGHVEDHFIQQGLSAGMDCFESKPLYANRLMAILK